MHFAESEKTPGDLGKYRCGRARSSFQSGLYKGHIGVPWWFLEVGGGGGGSKRQGCRGPRVRVQGLAKPRATASGNRVRHRVSYKYLRNSGTPTTLSCKLRIKNQNVGRPMRYPNQGAKRLAQPGYIQPGEVMYCGLSNKKSPKGGPLKFVYLPSQSP